MNLSFISSSEAVESLIARVLQTLQSLVNVVMEQPFVGIENILKEVEISLDAHRSLIERSNAGTAWLVVEGSSPFPWEK